LTGEEDLQNFILIFIAFFYFLSLSVLIIRDDLSALGYPGLKDLQDIDIVD
jgi:hypothetical protein